MLAMQIAVKDGTVHLEEKLQDIRRFKGDERPLALESNVLSDREYDIVKEADRALALLENDGSAMAFAEMFQMVRRDMLTVKARLALTDTGVVTAGVEDEIIKNLRDMVDSLKKQRQANKDKNGKPKPPQGQPKSPGEDPLVDLIASSSCSAPCSRVSIIAPASTPENITVNRRRRRTPPRIPRSVHTTR